MAINNNLYPGIVDTYMPAFLIDDDVCRVYFSLSDFNDSSDIKYVQATVLNQKTNTSVLDSTKYPSKIKVTTLQEDTEREGDDKYYFEINGSDLQEGVFTVDQYYKVQFRFTGTEATDISLTPPQAIDSWLMTNLQYFSEWSSICLIRGISTPVLSVLGFDAAGPEHEIAWNTSNIQIIGKLEFVDGQETETLKDYRIRLYKRENDELLFDTGVLYSDNINNVNQFTYILSYFLEHGTHYYFAIDYTTRNLYKSQEQFFIIANRDSSLDFEPSMFKAQIDNENGRIAINVRTQGVAFNDDIAIVRASSKTNFTVWEDIHQEKINQSPSLNYIWYDMTVESGILYKYGVQRRHPATNKQSELIKLENPVGVVLEYTYLLHGGKQLAIKFNNQVSSMKRMFSDVKIDTIGGQFPYIKRNGDMNYRTFPISGLVSFLMDEDKLFTTREEIYGAENVELYDAFDNTFDISDAHNYTYEREFRNKVGKFLTEDNIKLFRSPTEGNILIRLMDVSFSPDQVTGRYIWTFSATAYEMDDCSIAKYNEYGIQPIKGE